MNPTPVVTISTGPQQQSNQKQEILPKEFETQLARYLKKEQPSTIHKEVSDSEETTEKENQDEESNKESTEETLILDTPLLYPGLFNPRQEPQPAEMNLNEPSKNEVISPIKSNELTFDKQVNGETEKMVTFIQSEDLLTNRQQILLEESFVKPLTKEVTEPQTSLKDSMVMSEEPVKMEKITVSKPTIAIENTSKANREILVEDVTTLLMEESSMIETEPVQAPVKKEPILSTGRFLTAEWKNGQIVNQSITEPDILTVNSLNELPIQISESLSTEEILKDSVSRLKNSESYEVLTLTKVTEVDAQGQPVQQQQIVEAAFIKQPSGAEPIKQAGIQLVGEVVTQQAEAVLSGKQSIAHVTLTPERMGEVNITVELKDNVLITKIVVDTMETKELLANGMHHLTDKLDCQNIRLGELTIQLNENATAGFSSQERQREEKRNTFRQHQINFSDNEIEMLRTEEKTETNTGRLSILV